MNFLSWHYQKGIGYYWNRYLHALGWIKHQYSYVLLLKTLFSPYKRMVMDERAGFNLQKWAQNLTFNLISRGIGAIVRSLFLISGLILLILALILGFLGLIIWTFIPVFSLPAYFCQKKSYSNLLSKIAKKINGHPQDALKIIFSNPAGKFILNKSGIENLENIKIKESPALLEAKTWEKAVIWLKENTQDLEEVLRSKNLDFEDLRLAAVWQDQKIKHSLEKEEEKNKFGRPGIGLELLFGFTPNLDQYTKDLSISQPFFHRLIGRDKLIAEIERTLTSGKSVFLIGQPGVGKKTSVLEFAKRAANGDLGKQMAYRRVLELNCGFLLAESADLDAKKTKLSKILAEAARAGNVILVIRDIHRLTNSETEGHDFADIFAEYLEKKDLKIMAILSSIEYERFVAPDSRLAKFFSAIEVVPPNFRQALLILMIIADVIEKREKLEIKIPVLRRSLEGSDQYITEIPFPEKAIALLEEAVVLAGQSGKQEVVPEDVNTVLAQKTGISFSHLTQTEKDRLQNIEEIIHQKLINQNGAVDLIAKSLRARSVGVKDEKRPIGSFLFLGPTGVGKTQTAKVLAEVYYGSEKNILRFDMAEYSGNNGLNRLIGLVEKNQPGALTTAIKNSLASLLLLDEIEKAPPEIINLFLALLDEGQITDAWGKKINCRHLFVIATSNAGSEFIRQLVSGGAEREELQSQVLNYIQKEKLFSPEFLNRFDGVVVYEPLENEHLVKIAGLLLAELQDKLKKKNINLEIASRVCEKIAVDGYQPELGARPMRRIIDLVLGDLLGKAILNDQINSGDKIMIIPQEGKDHYSWEKIN
ncbi:MAG: AAA family ATPase [Candidatus Shapirobacteria bacterium]